MLSFRTLVLSVRFCTLFPVPCPSFGVFVSLVFFLLGISLVFLSVFCFFSRILRVRKVRKVLGVFRRVARLQNEVGTKDFFRATNFLTKNAPKFSPKFLSLYLWVRKNPQNPRQNFRQISLPKIKKKSPTSFCRIARRMFFFSKRLRKRRTGIAGDFLSEVLQRILSANFSPWFLQGCRPPMAPIGAFFCTSVSPINGY